MGAAILTFVSMALLVPSTTAFETTDHRQYWQADFTQGSGFVMGPARITVLPIFYGATWRTSAVCAPRNVISILAALGRPADLVRKYANSTPITPAAWWQTATRYQGGNSLGRFYVPTRVTTTGKGFVYSAGPTVVTLPALNAAVTASIRFWFPLQPSFADPQTVFLLMLDPTTTFLQSSFPELCVEKCYLHFSLGKRHIVVVPSPQVPKCSICDSMPYNPRFNTSYKYPNACQGSDSIMSSVLNGLVSMATDPYPNNAFTSYPPNPVALSWTWETWGTQGKLLKRFKHVGDLCDITAPGLKRIPAYFSYNFQAEVASRQYASYFGGAAANVVDPRTRVKAFLSPIYDFQGKRCVMCLSCRY